MADAALFVGFGHPVRGRERQAMQVFNEGMQLWGQLQARGEIESFEAALLGAHGGDLGGFMLLRGDRAKLAAVRWSDEFLRLIARAGLIVESLGVVPAVLGEELGRQMALFQEAVEDLT